jgi:hypothetical protein
MQKNLNSKFQINAGRCRHFPDRGAAYGHPIPKEQAFEVDGVPFTGKLSVTAPAMQKSDGKLISPGKPLKNEGKAKIWLTTTNQFEKGGRDLYYLMNEVDVTDEKAEIDISKYPSGFFKIVLEGKYNSVNRWIVEK